MRATDNHLILRTAWLYGLHGANFIKTIVKKALAAQTLLKNRERTSSVSHLEPDSGPADRSLVQTPARACIMLG